MNYSPLIMGEQSFLFFIGRTTDATLDGTWWKRFGSYADGEDDGNS